MKIARVIKSGKETFGLVKDDKIATKDDITHSTGIPIPQNIRDFLFDGLSEFDVLAPIPNPNKIICLAFNYKDHAKEQKLTPPKEPGMKKFYQKLMKLNSSMIYQNLMF